MAECQYYSANQVAVQLQVSPSTLRRWSNEFADFLSDAAGRPEATSGGAAAQRRYTDQDVEMLTSVRDMLAAGLTYLQAGRRLATFHASPQTVGPAEGDAAVTSLAPSPREAPALAPAVTVLADTLHTVAGGQQLLLNSQQAQRDLLTVVLRDNFSLKEENAKLRDRMLELERDVAEMRRLEASRREDLESRLDQLEARPREQPRPAARAQQRTGCLGLILPIVR